jgi:uncharacterized membrane protein
MLLWLALIGAFVLLIRTKNRVEELEHVTTQLRETVGRLSRKLADLEVTPRADDRARPAVASEREELHREPRAPEPIAADEQEVEGLESEEAIDAEPTPWWPGQRPESEVEHDTPFAPNHPVLVPAMSRDEAMARATVEGADAESGGVSEPPIPPFSAPPSPPVPPEPRPSFDWEGLIGVKLFSWIAGCALALAAVFFLRYSIDHGWLGPAVRMAIGILVGVGLLVGCELKAARSYPQTANALDAAGIAILFSTFFAAHALWHLIPALGAFALLVMVTGVAVMLSIRRQSLFIALLGLLGGFATPAMLSSGQDNPIGLFGYLVILNAGLAWVAYKKRWPHLPALSFLFTTFYQWGWVTKFLTAGKVPLAIGIFLIFPILSFISLAIGKRKTSDEREEGLSSLFSQTAGASAALPLLFAVYLAAVPAYGARFGLLFGFLLCLDVGLFLIAAAHGPRKLHLLGALSTILVVAIWLNGSYQSEAWPWILAFVSVFVLFYLGAPFIVRIPILARRLGGELNEGAERAVFASPLLLCAIPVLIAIEPRAAAPGLPFAALFLLLAACAAVAIIREQGAIHFIAAFFALVAEAVWSAKYLSPDRLLPGLALYGIFGLFYVGVPIVARRFRKALQPQGAAAMLTLASIALLFFLTAGSVAQVSLWGLALLLAILNVGLFLESASWRMPLLSIAGVALSWVVLAVWWLSATVTLLLLPALLVVAGFALLALGGNIWARRSEGGEVGEEFDRGMYLGLIGHLFLFFVATQATLSVPPWPLLAVMGVLDLAIGAAALYTRRGELHFGAIVASALILMLWETVARIAPWPAVAIMAAGVLVALAFAWIYLARRRGGETQTIEAAAAGAAILAQVVAIVASMQSGSPALGFLVGAQLVFIASALALAAAPRWNFIALWTLVPAVAAGFLYQRIHSAPQLWVQQLLFTVPIYFLFLAYPLVLRRRVGTALEPYLAAVGASGAFFFQARRSLALGELESVIGMLPVAQAALMSVLLVQLLRVERPGARTLGRLALVAGAVLAFVTVAIPLQLEKNWITIGWALEGAALAWLYRRIPHRGLLLATAGLLAVVFVRLALNPAVFTYEPRAAMRILNWYLYTYLICASAMLLAGWLLSKTDDLLSEGVPRLSSLLPAAGTLLLFLLLNIEIADFYATGPTITFNFSAAIAQDLTYTLGWALFAIGLLAAGIILRNRPARIASIGLLAVTVLKCFLHDLGRLDGLYRVGSFVGLAICLSLVAVAIQKFVMAPRPKEAR